ncbi:hypothetical protein ACFL19_02255 [Pseudomonadota bacterium]
MDLDLRRNGCLSIEHAELISKLEPVVREEYNEYIGKLTKENHITELGWLTRVTSRNTYISLIHDSLCRLALLEDLLDRHEPIKLVMVDSAPMQTSVKAILEKYACDAQVDACGEERSVKFLLIRNILQSLYLICNLWFWPKIIRGKKVPQEDIVYLDNFVYVNSFDKNHELKDRNYPGLIECAPDHDRQHLWYAPTLIGLKTPIDFCKMFFEIRKSKTLFLMREDWLKATDYLKALYLSYTLPSAIRKISKWRGYDISLIVKEEIRLDRCSKPLANALMRYLFFQRLAEHNVRLRLVIDWCENQVIDRALNLGVKKFYPGVYVRGYQGFIISDYYACQQPTSYEFDAGTLPDELCVVGDAYVAHRKQYCPELNVTVAPAFRFQEIIHYKEKPVDKNEILVLLPVTLRDCRDIIQLCLEVNIEKRYRFIIKPHPAYTKERFIKLVPEVGDKRFVFSNEPVHKLFDKAALLVSSNSSVCVEAIAANIPVAIIGSRSGPAMNPLAGYVDKRYWCLCYTSAAIMQTLNREHVYAFDREYYFREVTVQSGEAFLQ